MADRTDRWLLREIIAVLVLKLCALVLLWWAFVADQRVPVDGATTAEALVGAPPDPAPARGSLR